KLSPHLDVGRKLHVDRLPARPLARLAASAARIEGEIARRDPARDRAAGAGEEPADLVPRLRVGHRIGASRASERTLIDQKEIRDRLQALDAVVLADVELRAALDPARVG